MNKRQKVIGGLFIVVMVCFIGRYVFFNEVNSLFGVDPSAVDWEGAKAKQKNTEEAIRIPGFTQLTFDAQTTKQQVNFYNPEENDCYFKLSLMDAQGERLWQSDLIEPGKGLYEIELNKALAEGSYENAVLKYECFTYDENQSPLNGSEINLTIQVV